MVLLRPYKRMTTGLAQEPSQTEVEVVGINPYLSCGLPLLFQKGTLTKGKVTIEVGEGESSS